MGSCIYLRKGAVHTPPTLGTPLSTYTEGSIIKINENGKPVEFYVAKHDYEAELNGTGKTLVVRKDCYDSREWNSTNVNAYATSTIDSWLNGDYKGLFSAKLQTQIGTTKFKYTPGNGDNTVATLQRAIFLLSVTEFGETASHANIEGTTLSIAKSLQIAYLNGSAVTQWTRSPSERSVDLVFFLYSDGRVNDGHCIPPSGSRPVFTLPSTIKIDKNGRVIE